MIANIDTVFDPAARNEVAAIRYGNGTHVHVHQRDAVGWDLDCVVVRKTGSRDSWIALSDELIRVAYHSRRDRPVGRRAWLDRYDVAPVRYRRVEGLGETMKMRAVDRLEGRNDKQVCRRESGFQSFERGPFSRRAATFVPSGIRSGGVKG